MPVVTTKHRFIIRAPGGTPIERHLCYITNNLESLDNTPEERQKKNKLFHRALFAALSVERDEIHEETLRKYYYENGRPISLDLDTITFPSDPKWDDGVEKFQLTKIGRTRKTHYKLDRIAGGHRELKITQELLL